MNLKMNRLMNNKLTWAVILVACFVGGCSSDDDDASAAIPPTDEETVNVEAYVLATSVADGDKTANLLLTSESLTEGTISPINNGLVNDGATEWVFYNDRYLYALTYNQGNAGTTRSYVLDSDGQMRARSAEYKVIRFGYPHFGFPLRSARCYASLDRVLPLDTPSGSPEASLPAHAG